MVSDFWHNIHHLTTLSPPDSLKKSEPRLLSGYSLGQFTGVALCIGGLCLAVFSDAEDSGSGGKNPILGDILVIAGTFGYAISNVAEILLYFTFALSNFLFYTIVPFVMKMSGSALFSLSVLTSDMWAVLIRLFVYHQKINLLYFLAYGVVAIGLIIYSVTDKDPSAAPDNEVGDSNIQYHQLLLDENDNWCSEIVPITKDEHSQQRVTEI